MTGCKLMNNQQQHKHIVEISNNFVQQLSRRRWCGTRKKKLNLSNFLSFSFYFITKKKQVKIKLCPLL